MRLEPEDKYANKEAYNKMMVAKVTRILAIAMAFMGTFYFFIKLLFL